MADDELLVRGTAAEVTALMAEETAPEATELSGAAWIGDEPKVEARTAAAITELVKVFIFV
jgi:hypothetical protein